MFSKITILANIYSTKPSGVIQKLTIVTFAHVSGENYGLLIFDIKNNLNFLENGIYFSLNKI